MSTDCTDSARRRLILSLARRASIQAPQSILEEAVHEGNVELIENMQQVLAKALKVNSNENDAVADRGSEATVYKSGGKITQLPSISSQYSRAGQLCKLEDCKTCFWNPVCQMENAERVLARSREVIQQTKDAIKEKVARDARMNRSRVAF